MIIDGISKHIMATSALKTISSKLSLGDAVLSIPLSARTFIVASLFAQVGSPILYVVPGEENAQNVYDELGGILGIDKVLNYPARLDMPWQKSAPELSQIGARTSAIERLNLGESVLVVASARSLMRFVPPSGKSGVADYFKSISFVKDSDVDFETLGKSLVAFGYIENNVASEPGMFAVHGGNIDLFPASAKSAVRIEFFGDTVEEIRKLLPSTGQTLGSVKRVQVAPVNELILNDVTISRAEKTLYNASGEDSEIAADLESIKARIPTNRTSLYLKELYGGTSLATNYLSSDTLVVLSEPRALFDDCSHYFQEMCERAENAGMDACSIFAEPKDLNFGNNKQLSLTSILTKDTECDAVLSVNQLQFAGADSKFLGKIRQLKAEGFSVVFSAPEKRSRDEFEQLFVDEHITFSERLCANDDKSATPKGELLICDDEFKESLAFPSAKLALISAYSLSRHSSVKSKKKKIDITSVTFPFSVGDYVVHATHGIALFKEIVRREIDGVAADFFLLEYAAGDKLYVPIEHADRISKYVGPDGSDPRLTRLNTADWSKTYARAKRKAKKLAFDLVDLYARRAQVKGCAFGADTPEQKKMEKAFPYLLTKDQESAIEDVKRDMEREEPMDRLLCGDVGFGKTEVALRAAFKCVMEQKQVMLLAPTTILAQQHFETFEARFKPFGVRVDVLSRMRTKTQTLKTIHDFASGKVDVLIGTHRLLSRDVNPKELGLVIIDEEQRFGVQHKEQLKNMREQIDVLTLSATPIPRSMQMSISGVRDMSLIMTPPTGRLPVKVIVTEFSTDTVSDAIRLEMARHGQVYYVSNRVRTIEDAVEHVREAAPEATIGLAHGQMSARQIEDVMYKFQMHEIDVLVATTIIESGLDNPHTNTLIIEDSEKLGLAQLYQLKGRVGRTNIQAYAYFMFDHAKPLTDEAVERLSAISEFQELGSGMRIAMKDLEIRGAGSLMGAEQHGNLSGVGFDLFNQMLGEAVAEAKGEVADVADVTDVTINLPGDFFFSDEYISDVDKRVLAYRKLASTRSEADIDSLKDEMTSLYGEMDEPAKNLFAKQRLKLEAAETGATSIIVTGGRLIISGVKLSSAAVDKVVRAGGHAFVKSKRITAAVSRDSDFLARALELLACV